MSPLKLKPMLFILLIFLKCNAFGAVSEKIVVTPVSQRTLIVGVLAPLSGVLKPAGEEFVKGVEFALLQLKGREGPQVELKVQDDKGTPEDSVRAIKTLIFEKKVQVILGPLTENALILSAPVVARYRVPLISPTPHVSSGIERSPYLFLINPTWSLLSQRLAQYFKGLSPGRRLAFLVDQGSQTSLRQAEGFGEELKKQLVPIVATAYYSSGLSDFSAQIAAFKAAGVDTVYMPGQAKDAATIMKQSFDLGLRWMYLGSPDWSSQELYSANNSSTIAHYFPLSYSIEHDSLLNKTFVATFTDQFKSAPSSISAWGYDSLNLAIAGAMASKMPNSIVALKDSLKELKSFEGVSGVYRMNKEGFNEKGVFIMETQTLRAHIKKVL